MPIKLSVEREVWPIAGSFRISRGARTEAVVVKASLQLDEFVGLGECVPYARYGETPESVCGQISSLKDKIENGLSRKELQNQIPAGAARNAVDCALWDLEAKRSNSRAAESAGLSECRNLTTAYTLSLNDPENMKKDAVQAASRPILKIKLGGDDDHLRISAVRQGAPDSKLIVDANESWTDANFSRNLKSCEEAGVILIEQPFPAGKDHLLKDSDTPIVFCADESVHTSQDILPLTDRYQAINIKLDKSGGLTEAIEMKRLAVQNDVKVMVGCMIGTSLAMAPAMIIAQGADFVDLDGPLLLAKDRSPGIKFEGSTMFPPPTELWG